MLIGVSGRSVFCRRLRVYYPSRFSASAQFHRRDCALLRILIYKIDSTVTFGKDVPTLLLWTPPRAIVHVQAILFASLMTSLFSAFLAMLGKQWLNRYDSTDMRGTAIECSQDRQRKLDGIVAWHFNNVMESLPLMLQAALLLFGCALSRYFWEVDIIIASVVLGVTSFGFLSYFFIVIAGTASEGCPYQTPGAHILRYHLMPVFRSIPSKFSGFIQTSYSRRQFIDWWVDLERPWYSTSNTISSLLLFFILLFTLVVDVCRLGRTALRSLVAFGNTMHHWFKSTFAPRTHYTGQESIFSDLRGVSRVLQTSLDKAFHLTALEYLAIIPQLPSFDPSLLIGCFNVLISCINIVDDSPVTVQGWEQLATLCCLFPPRILPFLCNGPKFKHPGRPPSTLQQGLFHKLGRF